MDKVAKQRFMAIFIGFIMVASMVGFAMLNYRPEGPGPVVLPSVLNRTLTPEERVGILRGMKVLIEYFHNGSCIECLGKEEAYKNFVESREFKDYAILSYGISENETMDWMLNLDGTQIDLTDINSTKGLRELFCEVAIITPNICVLQEI